MDKILMTKEIWDKYIEYIPWSVMMGYTKAIADGEPYYITPNQIKRWDNKMSKDTLGKQA